MVNNTSIGDVTANLEAVDSNHSIFDGVPLDANNQVPVWDDTALGPDDNIDLLQTTDFGNGTVIAQEAGSGFPWIVHWNTGDEFYAGSGAFAGGPRLYLSGGSDDDPNSWGGENFTPAGEQLLLNAINVMAIPEPSTLVSAFIGLLLLGGCAMRRRTVR